ncbi:MAG: lysophospholipid acyltransferase family protein [Solirubrobacterales bacterium]
MPASPEKIPLAYRLVLAVCAPVIRFWGRLETAGLENLPADGPVVLVGNHDSNADPVAIGMAARKRRQIRALAKSTLWDIKPFAPILDAMGQIPVQRGKSDANALAAAIDAVRGGACVGVFPEGTISRGKTLRARSGVGRIAIEAPEATLVCVATTGTVDVVRFPKRPRIRVEFFLPESGGIDPTEDPGALSARCLAECRARAPITVGGRRKTEAKWRAAAESEEAAER